MNPGRDGYMLGSAGTHYRSNWSGLVLHVCRHRAWRKTGSVPAAPAVVAKSNAVYECPSCEERPHERRCPEYNLWSRHLGAGAPCPHCDELVVLSDILDAEQLVSQPHSHQRDRR